MTCFDPCPFSKKTFKKLHALEEDLIVLDYQSQHAKKVVSDSQGLVDFAIPLVFFVLNLPNGQAVFWGEIQITEGL